MVTTFCKQCGSTNVLIDAYVNANDPEDVRMFDEMLCEDCDNRGSHQSFGTIVPQKHVFTPTVVLTDLPTGGYSIKFDWSDCYSHTYDPETGTEWSGDGGLDASHALDYWVKTSLPDDEFVIPAPDVEVDDDDQS